MQLVEGTAEAASVKGPRLVGLGVAALDVLALVDRLPAAEWVGPAREVALAGGGPVATACATAAKLGCATALLDVVGDDWVGDEIVRGLQDAGVDCSRIRRARGARSPMAAVWVEAGTGRRSIAFDPGTVPIRALDDSDAAAIASCDCLHLNGRHWPTCLDAARLARDAGVLVSFDGGAGRYRAELRELASLADVCIVAGQFAQEWTGRAHPEDQLHAMRSVVRGTVGVTHGLRGSWIAPPRGGSFHQEAYPAEPLVDTTGCGDSYHGAFLFGLLDGRGDRAAARLASAVAATAASALGGRAGLPDLPVAEALARGDPA